MSIRLRPYESLYKAMSHSALRRGKPVSLTYEQFVSFTNITCCHYCGDPVHWKMYSIRQPDKFRSCPYNLDRKDNTLWYTVSNLVVCCSDCNRGKGNMYTYEEWLCMTAALKQYRRQREEQQIIESQSVQTGFRAAA